MREFWNSALVVFLTLQLELTKVYTLRRKQSLALVYLFLSRKSKHALKLTWVYDRQWPIWQDFRP